MEQLKRQEDADLRRLAALTRYGVLATETEDRFRELRARDRRLVIREPADLVIPLQRTSESEYARA